MGIFNSKKFAVKSYEDMLRDNNKEHGLKADDEAVNFNETLDSDRKPNDGEKPIQKALEKKRVAAEDTTTEGKLNEGKVGKWLRTRDDSGEHPMDYHKRTEDEYNKAYAKAQKKNDKKVEPVSEENVGEDVSSSDKTKVVGNNQRSQLLSNFDSREDFRKKNRSMKKASTDSLRDADGVIYHVYRTAAEEKRPLNKEEEALVAKVNEEKIKVLAQEYMFHEQANPNIHEQDRQIMGMDDLEGQKVDNPVVGEYQPHPGDLQGANRGGMDSAVDVGDQGGGNLDAEFAALAEHEGQGGVHSDGSPMDIDLDVQYPHSGHHHDDQHPF